AAQSSPVEMTLERMVDLTLSSSYRIRDLNMSIEQTRRNHEAERAGLRSHVSLDLSVPELESIAEPRWNSTLGIDEIVHENSRRWEAQLSIRQPVILFGYPTNGYLSLNNRVYRYSQLDDEGARDVRYYNRYFVRYTQPLFQPNELKNELEEAELDLEDSELEFYADVVEIVDDLSGDYFELFEDAYQRVISERLVENLEEAVAAAEELAASDPARAIDLDQARVELANAEEQLQQSRSQFRLQAASLKTRLNLAETDSITLDPVIAIDPVPIDVERATSYALQLTPRLRRLDIEYRREEIDLEETRGNDSFRLNLELSYGRERQDPRFGNLWDSPTNTYTVDVSAYLPIWDWGRRRARVEAGEIGLERTRLEREEAMTQIVSDVANEARNVQEYQERALNMERNLELAAGLSASSLELYRAGSASILDVLQSFRRESDTARNLLDAYLGWRRALQRMQRLTYYDFERDMPVLERYGVRLPEET
ncbi:MAG TPA: TolC family protein, partial [Longimicrobiales bacterium]|nr:TolC family protein [Longimicrobiales bacterium]